MWCGNHDESYTVECKGGEQPLQPMTLSTLRSSYYKTVSKAICAFLNTEGGVVYVGVHDKERVIQGTRVEGGLGSLNDFKRKTIQSIQTQLQPSLHPSSIRIPFHLVCRFHPNSPLLVPVTPPDLFGEYHRFLQGQVSYLAERLSRLPPSESPTNDFWLMEILVRKADDLFFYVTMFHVAGRTGRTYLSRFLRWNR